MNVFKHILQEIAKNEDITISALEKSLGASKGVLSRAIKNNTDIQAKWLFILVEKYPQYDSFWILTGKGEMIKRADENNASQLQRELNAMEETIYCQRELIENYKEKIKILTGQLKQYEIPSGGEMKAAEPEAYIKKQARNKR